MGQLESLHTCPPGETSAWPTEETRWEPASEPAELGALGEHWAHAAYLQTCGGLRLWDLLKSPSLAGCQEPRIPKISAGYGRSISLEDLARNGPVMDCIELQQSLLFDLQKRTGNSPEIWRATEMGLWLLALWLSAGSLPAGRVSWKEIKHVLKPAWQAVKILPSFCQFCRKCHTSPSIQAEISKKCFSFPVIILEI